MKEAITFAQKCVSGVALHEWTGHALAAQVVRIIEQVCSA